MDIEIHVSLNFNERNGLNLGLNLQPLDVQSEVLLTAQCGLVTRYSKNTTYMYIYG